MQCPSPIAEIVGDILRTGLLRIRNLDFDIARCRVEADHLHNLPGILTDYQSDLLIYYWTVERISYIARCKPEDAQHFEPLWKSLAKYLPSDGKRALAG